MPAKSEKEAHLMQMALAVKTGKEKLANMPAGVRDKIKKLIEDMTESQLRDFTKVQEAKKEKTKYLITYTDGSTKTEELTDSQREGLKKRKDWSKIKNIRGVGKVKKVEEEGEAGPAGGATPDNIVGNGPGYYYLGQDAQKRELTPEEEAMLGMTDKLEDGGVKVMSYDDFRAKSVKENFTTPDKITEAIASHFGDFGHEAHNAIKKLPVINGLVEIRSINEALSGKYKESQIRKVIDAISNKSSS